MSNVDSRLSTGSSTSPNGELVITGAATAVSPVANDLARGDDVAGVGSEAFFLSCWWPGKGGGGKLNDLGGAFVGVGELTFGTEGIERATVDVEEVDEEAGEGGPGPEMGKDVCEGLTEGMPDEPWGVGAAG